MNNWFLITCRFTKEFTDGTLKRVSEQYLLNAFTYTDAEAKTTELIGQHIRGEFLIQDIKKKTVSDIFEYDDSERIYEAKVEFVSEDADTGKEVKIKNCYLVYAQDINEAFARINDNLKGFFVSCELTVIAKSKIVEIFNTVGYQYKIDSKKIENEL